VLQIALEVVNSKQAKEPGAAAHARPPADGMTSPPVSLPRSPPPSRALQNADHAAADVGPVFVEAARNEDRLRGDDESETSVLVGGLSFRTTPETEGEEQRQRVRSELGAGTSGGSQGAGSGDIGSWSLEGPSGSDAKSPLEGKKTREKERNNGGGRSEEGATKKEPLRDAVGGLWEHMQAAAAAAVHNRGGGGTLARQGGGKKGRGGDAEGEPMEVVVTGNKKPKQGAATTPPETPEGKAASEMREGAERSGPLGNGASFRGLEMGDMSGELASAAKSRGLEVMSAPVQEGAEAGSWAGRGGKAAAQEQRIAARARTLEYHLRQLEAAQEAYNELAQGGDAEGAGDKGQRETLESALAFLESKLGELESELEAAGSEAGAGREEAEVPSPESPEWPVVRAWLNFEFHHQKVHELMALADNDLRVVRALSGKARELVWQATAAKLGGEATNPKMGGEEASEPPGLPTEPEAEAASFWSQCHMAWPAWAREKLERVRTEWEQCGGEERHEIAMALGGLEEWLLQGKVARLPAVQAELDRLKAVVEAQSWAQAAAAGEEYSAGLLRWRRGSGFPESQAEGVVLLRTWWRTLERLWEVGEGAAGPPEGDTGRRGGKGEFSPVDARETGVLVAAVEELLLHPESPPLQQAVLAVLEKRERLLPRSPHLSSQERDAAKQLRTALGLLVEMQAGKRPVSGPALALARGAVARAGQGCSAAGGGVLEAEILVTEWLLGLVDRPLTAPLEDFETALMLPAPAPGELHSAFRAFQEALHSFGLGMDDWSVLEAEGQLLPQHLKPRDLLGMHAVTVLYNTLNLGSLPGLAYPRLSVQQGDAWNLEYLKLLTSFLMRHDGTTKGHSLLFNYDRGSGLGWIPDGYNARWPAVTAEGRGTREGGQLDGRGRSAPGAEFAIPGLTAEEAAQLREVARTRHWLAVLEGPFQDLTGWQGWGDEPTRPVNPNEGALMVHALLLTDLLNKRVQYAPLFQKLAAAGVNIAGEVEQRLPDVGRVLGFGGRTPLEWALVSRKVPLLLRATPTVVEPLMFYEEAALLKLLQSSEPDAGTPKAANGIFPDAPAARRMLVGAAPRGPPSLQAELALELLGSPGEATPFQALLQVLKRAADRAARSEFARVKAGRRAPRDVLRLRVALMQSAQLAYAQAKVKLSEKGAKMADALAELDVEKATREALGEEAPLGSSGERWRLGEAVEELFPGEELPAAGEVDLELVRQAGAFFEQWRFCDATGSPQPQTAESSQAAAGLLEGLLQMTTERAVRKADKDERLSKALDSLHDNLVKSFAPSGTSGRLPWVVESVLGVSSGKGGVLGGGFQGQGVLEGARGAVLFKAYRSVLWSPEFLKTLESARKTLHLPGEHFADVRERLALRKGLFEGGSQRFPASFLNKAEGGLLAPLISLEELKRGTLQEGTRGSPQERALGNPVVEAELYELLWAYLRAYKGPAEKSSERTGGLEQLVEGEGQPGASCKRGGAGRQAGPLQLCSALPHAH
jgi:hypothetical protein